MLQHQSYDYVFLGAGCASLSIIMRMLENRQFADKKILLIDKAAKTQNDRTWCYWESGEGFFEGIIHKKWDTISFFSSDYSSDMTITPYQYKMIRGVDFYNYCFDKISAYPSVELVYGEVKSFSRSGNKFTLSIDGETKILDAGIVFNSIVQPDRNEKKNIQLLQHFKGWVIETDNDTFNTEVATMMDFRVPQNKGTTFAYVLPFDKRTALVEYTLFTRELLSQAEYDAGLNLYIQGYLGLKNYRVTETEFGIIPMTSRRFYFEENEIYNIGTAGGQTKASSGYTFQFIQKQAQRIVDFLSKGKELSQLPLSSRRFRFYDNVLLHILYYNKLPGDSIFSRLFKSNEPQKVLKFLDNETSLAEELKIISTLPTMPFLKAALKQL
ncbi:MAG TPA: lycopene cyclase family protein [Chitinophagaceae bacterium]|nr:lycopene cyclase family protein [Chitinophagaceae bacterium]HMU58482.1 lycopene cyclase family protein [Chitinophagaceae bacterium]